eukprot:scaffold6123_cov113-Isochrysis_galbana.AAC.13
MLMHARSVPMAACRVSSPSSHKATHTAAVTRCSRDATAEAASGPPRSASSVTMRQAPSR